MSTDDLTVDGVDGDQGSGLWRIPGIPHRGWRCFDMIDLEEGREVCQMCERMHIRFVHIMMHDDPSMEGIELRCGCICAGHLEGDGYNAERRQRSIEQQAARNARLEKFLPSWKVARSGAWWFKHRSGFRGCVYRTKGGNGWGFVVTDPDATPTFGRQRYLSVEDARVAARIETIVLAKKYFAEW